MADKIIEVGANTKPAHGIFLGWLNSLIENYVSSFYDDAIKNIIMLSFIREHNCFMLEMYLNFGTQNAGFLTMLPTDSTNSILMLHDNTGKPYLYNDENINDILEFDANGRLVRFFENVVIPMKDETGVAGAECFITFEDFYGVKAPMLIVRYLGSNQPIGKGYLDVPYENRYSGAYMVNNVPLDNFEKYSIKNISKMDITVDIPVLKNLSIRYVIVAGQSVIVPITEFTKYFVETSKDLNNLVATKIQ